MKTFKLSISTPIGKNYETDNAVIVNAFLLEGRIGVMANHSPIISSIKVSDFKITLDDNTEVIGVVDGGVFTVSENEVNILTPRFELSNEIDVKQAEDEISEIKYMLQSDVKEAEEASLKDGLDYSELRLRIANK